MKSSKKVGLITIITVITIMILILTYTFLPAYIKDRGNLHTAWEKGQWHLTNDDYDELVIEYDYVQNFAPDFTAVNVFDDILKEYTDKEEITHEMGDVIPVQDTKSVYNERDMDYFEGKYRDEETEGDTLVIYVLYLNGRWKDEEVLGLSYRGTNMVLFMETIMKSAERSTNLEHVSIETSVLIHEWGHLIGLVGRDYDSEHESTEYPHHCTQEDGRCVMAASVEINAGSITEAPPTDFCELCQDDIEMIRTMYDYWGPAEILTYIAMGGQSLIGLTWVVSIGKEEKVYTEQDHEYDSYHDNNDYTKEDKKKYY
ncbi:MAG: hypothetical protein ACOC53_00630 [Candidatus Saliniplasma sp.]